MITHHRLNLSLDSNSVMITGRNEIHRRMPLDNTVRCSQIGDPGGSEMVKLQEHRIRRKLTPRCVITHDRSKRGEHIEGSWRQVRCIAPEFKRPLSLSTPQRTGRLER
jgi:hypothetical protein